MTGQGEYKGPRLLGEEWTNRAREVLVAIGRLPGFKDSDIVPGEVREQFELIERHRRLRDAPSWSVSRTRGGGLTMERVGELQAKEAPDRMDADTPAAPHAANPAPAKWYVLEWNMLDDSIDLYEWQTSQTDMAEVRQELEESLHNESSVFLMDSKRLANLLAAAEAFKEQLKGGSANESGTGSRGRHAGSGQ